MDEWMFQRRLEELRKARQQAHRQAEFERMVLLAQFQRFKLCTCVPQGRYGTCCKRLESVRDGFFYIGDLWR